MLFGSKYWFILLIAVVAAAIIIVLLLYYKNKEVAELTKWQIRILRILRFLSFFLIAFLLLSPFLKSLKKTTQDPIILAAWDNSESIISGRDSLQNASKINNIQNQIVNGLDASYQIINYTFGEKTTTGEKLNFENKKSNYSEMISTLTNNHFNENIGAIIVTGDGIYNEGKNPVNITDEFNVPVYSVGLGDTTEIKDARIQNINVNRTSFSGNQFPVEIDAQFSKLKGIPLKLSVINEGKEYTSTIITPPNDNFFSSQKFIIEAGNPGLKHFKVNIEPAVNERNTKNNTAEFVINVLENKQKILILSDGAHPDIGAIKNTLDLQKTYEVTVFTEEPYPSNLSDFNLIILNQLPNAGKSMASVINEPENTRIPILFIVGQNTFLPQFNVISSAAEIKALAGPFEEAQAAINPAYATFAISEELIEIVPQFPPLLVPFANFNLASGVTPLFFQKIKNIETANPLIASGNYNGKKTGYIFGEGIWRWRLYNYYLNQTHNQFNEFINSLIQYLALRENEDNFIVNFKPVYDEIEDIVLNAEVYNDAFESIASEEISITIKNEAGDEFDFIFDIKGDNYQLNAGNLPVGDYQFNALVNIGDQSYTEEGEFTVIPVNIENMATSANHRILYQLASNSGGKFYLPENIDKLISDLKNSNSLKPVSFFQESINELLNLRWLFFVLILLLSVEWFLRKYWGIY